MIYGRDAEMEALRAAWARARAGTPQLAVVWGRRRVGKTFLLSELTRHLPCVYFTATRNDTETDQLGRLYEAVQRGIGSRAELAGGGFRDLDGALRFLLRVAVDEPLVVVIDEAPRLASARPDLGDVLAAVWDQRPRNSKLLLVVCGSAVAAMRDLIGPDGGLYRRADPELRIDPLDPWAAMSVLGGAVTAETVVHAYAACGGYPLHLAAWDGDRSVQENLRALAGSPGGILVRDALDIMFEDLDFRSGYERVLATMATGPTRRSKIAGRAQQRIDETLKRLQRSGYVAAERPIGAPETADPLYRLVDPYLRFWFSVLRTDADLIEGGQGRAVLRRVLPRWEVHVQSVFEEMARGHAVRQIANGALTDAVVGRWWKDEVTDIDAVGLDRHDRAVLVGEAKWQERPFTAQQLGHLRTSAARMGGLSPDVHFVVWSRHGLDAKTASFPDVVGFTPAEMFEIGTKRRR